MKKTNFKNIDLTVTREYRVICAQKDYKGDWTSDYNTALTEMIQHQRDTSQTHDVKVEEKVTKITTFNAAQFELLK